MSAGLCALAFAGAAFAQSDEALLQKKKAPPQTVVENLIDSPRITGSVPTNGAGDTGFVSQKKKTPPKKGQAQKQTKKKSASAPQVPDASLAARNPSLLRMQTVEPEITGSVSPLRKRRLPPEEEPFGAVGFYSGAFLVKPSIELQSGYNSNAERVANGKGSWFNTLLGALNAQSQWQRHELVLDLRGTHTKYYDVDGADRPEVQANLRGRVDVSSQTKIELES